MSIVSQESSKIPNNLILCNSPPFRFDESSQFRVIKWMNASPDVKKSDSIIDLGTGNGMMLVELSAEGYTNLTGVDYSEKGIELAGKIAKDQNHDIAYKVADLLSPSAAEELGKFKICHDKGTYDAVSLMEGAKEKRVAYIQNVSNLMQDDGLFIITSCNFTEEELTESFAGTFQKHELIPTQVFKFGGKTGSVVTSIVFKKHL